MNKFLKKKNIQWFFLMKGVFSREINLMTTNINWTNVILNQSSTSALCFLCYYSSYRI